MFLAAVVICPAMARAQSEIFIGAGPVLPISSGFFDDSHVGWSINGGMRQAIAPRGPLGYFFVDLGGSFLSAQGSPRKADVEGSITIFNALEQPISTIALPNAIRTGLHEIDRASVDIAGGWTSDPIPTPGFADALFRFSIRAGGRVGHIHGEFDEQNTPTTDSIVATLLPGQTYSASGNYDKNDTFGGMFMGISLGLNATRVNTMAFGPVDIAIGTTAEFAIDWIDFNGYANDELGTASILFGATFSR